MSCSEWKEYKLEDLIINYNSKRKPLSSRERENRKGIYPYYGAQGIIDYLDDYIFDGEYLLIAEDGNNLKERNEDIARIAKGKFWVNNHAHIITNNELSDMRFLKYYINTLDISAYITGSAQPKLNKANLSNIKIKAPSLEEQKKIADILSSLDDKIELNNEMNKTLEEMAQSIFKRWFVDFEFLNEDGQPYKTSGGEMVESELGMIPKGWEVKKMKDISSLMMGISPKSSSYNNEFIGVPLLNGAGDFDNGQISPTKYTTEAKRVCNKGDIILSIRGTIGNLNFSDGEYCLGRSMCALRGKEDIDNMLIFMYMSKSIEQLKSNAIGSVILGLSKPDIEEIMIAYPSYEIRKSLNDILSNLYSRKKHNINENNNIKAIRETLLPKLMGGDISTI